MSVIPRDKKFNVVEHFDTFVISVLYSLSEVLGTTLIVEREESIKLVISCLYVVSDVLSKRFIVGKASEYIKQILKIHNNIKTHTNEILIT